MLELFRKDQPLGYILLFFYCVLLRIPSFIGETNWTPLSSSAFSDIVYNAIGYTSMVAQITGTLLIFIQAILINVLVNNNRITRESSLFPGLFYIFICTMFPDFNYLSPALMANTFVILALFNVFSSYKKSGQSGDVFNAGLFVSTAMLFDFSYCIFFISCFVGFLIVRSFRFIERVQYFLGFVIPIFLGGTYYFWMGRLPDFLMKFPENIKWLDWAANVNYILYIKLAILVFLLLLTVLNYSNYGRKNNVHAMRKVDVLLWFMLLPLITFSFQSGIRLDHFLIIAVPMGILLGYSMLLISNKLIADMMHLILISISFLFQYILL
ncbi:MAG: hypothetical protein IPO45_14940 [Saprospiraceae bacterium]|uniref:DUF6427 family protein n=1 Tax=Candidatus Brachybacter algidus TaxID=2982024 RepID=UPI001B546FAB|nr:DUF6427 family protein [Candidatus Brachybacter algidus]MBP7306362.1 hypothetical protein [Saprospiraceae bacterium]MBK6371673.1 hypothetical protein [Candidatus Brachybacter algidus]MBK6448959.1 hypothetical protein [Candidatus Brachybacter algidus]MBK8357326.1 hypothetical protein [Candidatus Brachybacter algidus]MBK9025997.1 hypothetical protein [Candidatus Brachybacter algidus]